MTDNDRQLIIQAYCHTPPGDDMIIPDTVTPEDAAIFAAHLEEIRYGEGTWHR